MSSSALTWPACAPARASELAKSLADVRQRVAQAAASPHSAPALLVAVSKLKPAEDIMGCYDSGQRDFGENYVAELVEKAALLPPSIQWHFIGTLQSNKAKALAAIPNLDCVHTVTSVKAATALDKGIPPMRMTRLNVLLQVNTSGEASKSGLASSEADAPDGELLKLAQHVVTACPRLHLLGLMTIGSLEASLNATDGSDDFAALIRARNALHVSLPRGEAWGRDGCLVLSMGMSSDYEAAISGGSGIVRVGSAIFGAR